MFHIALHFIAPLILVAAFYRNNWKQAYLILISTMLVDLDHLMANPIYDPNRCSIGFHPLHQFWFILLYLLLIFFPKSRLVGLGLSLHMALDSIDCQTTNGAWSN
ncbi:hypothetical protein DXV75_12655 [Alteromonas aestuariivivens]|uniref:Metal-dependent hydrolase n=1 Tax=Alteromonas aestuariivivens TaxID=1938339 RepID=A0A3D8M482_9ALTE|nr:DUF6122 family protein [Alteromonas aestuariivivens]RDV24553.1 hypothetical protein DXV75_12655 [Alteromonas aestuariivivens]